MIDNETAHLAQQRFCRGRRPTPSAPHSPYTLLYVTCHPYAETSEYTQMGWTAPTTETWLLQAHISCHTKHVMCCHTYSGLFMCCTSHDLTLVHHTLHCNAVTALKSASLLLQYPTTEPYFYRILVCFWLWSAAVLKTSTMGCRNVP